MRCELAEAELFPDESYVVCYLRRWENLMAPNLQSHACSPLSQWTVHDAEQVDSGENIP